MAITGLPRMSSAVKPACFTRERWPERAHVVTAEPSLAPQIGGLFSPGAHAVRSRKRAARRARAAATRAASSGDTYGRYRSRRRDAGQLGGVVQHAGRSPRIAQVLERHERRPQLLGTSPVLFDAASNSEQQRCGAMQPEPVVSPFSSKSRRCTIAGPLAHAADDLLSIDPTHQAGRDMDREPDRRGPPRT